MVSAALVNDHANFFQHFYSIMLMKRWNFLLNSIHWRIRVKTLYFFLFFFYHHKSVVSNFRANIVFNEIRYKEKKRDESIEVCIDIRGQKNI